MDQRHGITRRLYSSWRTQLSEGKPVSPSSAKSPPQRAFATVELEERPSAVIEGRSVAVRLEGMIDTARIASIAVALAGSP